MANGIQSEAQLTAAIEVEDWYDSDNESENDVSDMGSLGEEVDWTEYFWHTGDQLYYESPPGRTVDVNSLLEQLDETDHVDFSDQDVMLDTIKGENKESDETSETQLKLTPSEQVLGTETARSTSIASTDVTCVAERPKHYNIAYEILTSERTYVQSLRLLEKVVHGAIKTARLTQRPILPEQGRKEIFLNIGEIYALHFDLLQELEERVKNWDSNPMIADVLGKRAPFFKLYSMYSTRFDSAQVAYCKWIKASKQFAELIKLIETSPLCKGLPVSSYMLCPVQRIPRYKLLLEDYLRHLPEGNADFDNTKATLAAISEVAQHMNERISDLENQAKVVQMQKTFIGKENIVAPGRKYVGRGPVYLVPGSKRRKQRVLFLFSDMLLIARITAAGRYKIHYQLPLKRMLVSVLQSPILHNAFCIAERGFTKPFRFCAKSSEERTKWITELNKAKTKEEGALSTMSQNSPYAAVLNDPEAHSSILAVLNDPSFEHSQPSWVRRTLQSAHPRVRGSIPFTSYALAAQQTSHERREGVESEGVEEVDFGEEIVVEFESEIGAKFKVLVPGLDNSLSSYMQYQCEGQQWETRWFVLTSRTLVCYQDHTYDVATGALSLSGYSVSTTQSDEVQGKPYIFKLSHASATHFFQLSTSYDFNRWISTLQELQAEP